VFTKSGCSFATDEERTVSTYKGGASHLLSRPGLFRTSLTRFALLTGLSLPGGKERRFRNDILGEASQRA